MQREVSRAAASPRPVEGRSAYRKLATRASLSARITRSPGTTVERAKRGRGRATVLPSDLAAGRQGVPCCARKGGWPSSYSGQSAEFRTNLVRTAAVVEPVAPLSASFQRGLASPHSCGTATVGASDMGPPPRSCPPALPICDPQLRPSASTASQGQRVCARV